MLIILIGMEAVPGIESTPLTGMVNAAHWKCRLR